MYIDNVLSRSKTLVHRTGQEWGSRKVPKGVFRRFHAVSEFHAISTRRSVGFQNHWETIKRTPHPKLFRASNHVGSRNTDVLFLREFYESASLKHDRITLGTAK